MARVRRKWTAEEDTLLRSAVKAAQADNRPLLWRKLAKSVPGRTNKDCRRRWWNSLANGTAKGSWAEEEDERLIAAVRRYGTNWIRVSCEVGSRSADQCSSHWSQVLDPNINYADWTADEDAKLLHAVLTHGTNWATIAHSHRPNRTTLALRNRYSTLRLQNNNNRSKANTETTEKATKTGSTSQTTMGNSSKEMDWNMEASRRPSWNGGEITNQSSDEDDGDEDDGDEDEEDDNEDNENEDDRLHQNNNTSAMKGILNSQAPSHDTSGKGIQTPESTFASWDTWVAGSMESNNVFDFKLQPLSTDNLEMDKTNQMQYPSLLGLNSSQYPTPGESYFSNISESGNLDTVVPKSLYDLDPTPMDINLTPSLDTFCTSPQPQTAPSTISNTTGAGASPGRASSVGVTNSKGTSITSAGGGKSPSTSPSNLSLDLPPTTLYQVSISMTCTRAQLDANMILLAGLGSSVTIQIDKKT